MPLSPPHSIDAQLAELKSKSIALRPLAEHPAGSAHLENIDRSLAIRERHRYICSRLMEPLFAWPFAAALTQFVLG